MVRPSGGAKIRRRGTARRGRRTIHGEHKGPTRRLLVEAALEQFDDLGCHATRIEDIAGAAGASRSTFYLRFRSEIDVVHELIAVVEPEAIFARLAELESPSWEDLRGTIAEFADFYARRRKAVRATEYAIAVDRRAEAVYQPTISRFAEGLAKHMASEGDGGQQDAGLRDPADSATRTVLLHVDRARRLEPRP